MNRFFSLSLGLWGALLPCRGSWIANFVLVLIIIGCGLSNFYNIYICSFYYIPTWICHITKFKDIDLVDSVSNLHQSFAYFIEAQACSCRQQCEPSFSSLDNKAWTQSVSSEIWVLNNFNSHTLYTLPQFMIKFNRLVRVEGLASVIGLLARTVGTQPDGKDLRLL